MAPKCVWASSMVFEKEMDQASFVVFTFRFAFESHNEFEGA
jgi:hypothetical protein